MDDLREQPIEILCMGTKERKALNRLRVKTLGEFAQLNLERVYTLQGYGATTYLRLQTHQKRLLEHEYGSGPAKTKTNEIALDAITRIASTRTMHVLERLGVDSLPSLLSLKDEQILNCRGAGKGVLAEINRIQKRYKPALQEMIDWRNIPASSESIEHLPLFSNVVQDISDVNLHDSYLPHQLLQSIDFPHCFRPYLGNLSATTLGELLLLPGKSLLGLEGFGQKKLEQLRDFTRMYLGASLVAHTCHTDEASLGGLWSFPLYTGIGNSQIQKANVHHSYYPTSRIEVLKLPARARSLFKSLHIVTIADLLAADPTLLLEQDNFGQKTLEATRQALTDYILCHPKPLSISANTCSLKDVISNYFHEVLSERLHKVMSMRLGLQDSPPMPLQDIAQRLGLTRERIRQIQIKAERESASPSNSYLLDDLRHAVRDIVIRSGGKISLNGLAQKLKCHYSWDSDCPPPLVAFTMGLFTEYEHNEDFIAVPDFPCSYCDAPESAIREALAESPEVESDLLSVTIARHCSQRQCKVYLENHIELSPSCISAYIAKRGALRDSYVMHKDIVCHLEHYRIKYGAKQDAVEHILKLKAKPLHFTQVASAYNQYRPGSTVSGNSIHALLNNAPKAILWDRGTFIHEDCVTLDSRFTRDVSHWISQKLNDNCRFISIAGAYKHFRSRCQELDIQSETALYSYLRLAKPEHFYLHRYPLVTLTDEPVSITQVLEEHVLDRGGEVSKDELLQLLKSHGFNNTLSIMISNAPSLLHADNDSVVHIDALNINLHKLHELCEYAQSLLADSSTITARKVYRDKRITCKLLGLTGPRLLFSCLQVFGGDHIATGRYPQLRSLDNRNSEGASVRSEFEDYIKSHAPCSHDQLSEHFVDSRGYSEKSLEALPYYSENVLRYAPRCYVHKDSLGWTVAEYDLLLRLLQDVCGQHNYPTLKEVFDYHYDSLPQLPKGLPWTFVLLQSLARGFEEINFIGNANNAYVATSREAPPPPLPVVICDILIRDYEGAALKEDLEKRLVKEGIIMKTVTPTMLKDTDAVVLKGKHVIVRDLCI